MRPPHCYRCKAKECAKRAQRRVMDVPYCRNHAATQEIHLLFQKYAREFPLARA